VDEPVDIPEDSSDEETQVDEPVEEDPTVGAETPDSNTTIPTEESTNGRMAFLEEPEVGATKPRIDNGKGVHYGIDVSNYQHITNYGAIVSHLRSMGAGSTPFCWVKVTEGSGYTDPGAAGRISGFQKAGCLTGAYHFFHSSAGVNAQLNHLLANRHGAKYVMIDAELDEANAGPNALALIRGLQKKGIKPILYTAGWLASKWGATRWGVPLWIAAYGSKPSVKSDLWQYTDSARVPGVSGNVDLDKSTCTSARFEQIFY